MLSNILGRSPPSQRGFMRRFCFYCNVKTSSDLTYQSSSNSYEWRCPLCEAVNVINEAGEIMDYTPEDTTAAENLITAATANNETESPFCRNCQTNHRIVMEALASYLPPEWDSRYKEYEKRLPSYKGELEQRYPPYCENCRDTVIRKLSENNYNARARLLGSLLNNKADERPGYSKSLSVFGMTKSNDFGTTAGGRILRPRWTLQTWLKIFVWICRGLFWWSHMFAVCGVFVINAVYPTLQLRKLALPHAADSRSIGFLVKTVLDTTMRWYISGKAPQALDMSEFGSSLFTVVYRITPFSILYFFWNYKLLYALLSTTRVTITGKTDYYRCQAFLFVELLVGLYTLPRMYYWSISEKSFRLVNMFFTTTTILVLAVSLASLKVRPVEYTDIQRQVQQSMEDHNSEPMEQEQPQSTKSQLQRHASFGRPQWIPSRPVSVTTPTTVSSGDDMMDWKPAFVPDISMTGAVPEELPEIPKLPPGYSLPPPPNGSKSNAAFLKQSIASLSQSSASSQGKEKYFQHRLVSKSDTQSSSTTSVKNTSRRDIGLATQRFFPAEEPTGLEDLFDPILHLSDSAGFTRVSTSSGTLSRQATRANDERDTHILREWVGASSIVIGLLAASVYLYQRFMPTAVDRLAVQN
ncbi:Ima1 N-terminal domain-containing protein [Lipomyces tetrasporus]|uniref:Ima1 N-terminal domain-containing protein n=1 Tax=Lipomyces tetrasporus TaxID=54092 RepID=A0AAD7QS46_9ASCO|nr:Ima1 N-terminal domain-containing protein [Lipomyces tetrasporus]KAJ8100308.1 Ima1 N-terminal domain-containing protein [Lipomyces tetrasporus]